MCSGGGGGGGGRLSVGREGVDEGFVNIEAPQALMCPESPHDFGLTFVQVFGSNAGLDPLDSKIICNVVWCCVEVLSDRLVEVVCDC